MQSAPSQKSLPTVSGTYSTALLEKHQPGQHPARCYMDAAGLWQQPLGEQGAPALEVTTGFEGEGAAPHFCWSCLSTQSKIYQELLCNNSLENTAVSAKSLATAAFAVELLLSGV